MNNLTKTWSLFDRNFHRVAKNIVNQNSLPEVARPWFEDFAGDPLVQSALQDLKTTGPRQKRALDYLGLDLVPAM
ncbi:MAG: hypothetical protein SPK50_05935 [Mobiluncus porci]|uniref:Uncharacterized protein n=1 Tax=Mobiluncus porci TaxID=2652278 RepID=A0A7K0K4D7_9ACTO|nr:MULTISPECIES: hypothetical protein [Mobiluncus]MCI6584384.1 hypothetical protein [Mobiluncus sp.]MDD7541804.1 hypothetical protein [Mobiluncus porci]MDY5748652.1 hypothetical protein [Mobiluncus porci]MST50341.1 hypothetical protein [Mobiluncus porci]